MSSFNTRRLHVSDELETVAAAINTAQWDTQNDLSLYSAAALRHYLAGHDRIFLVCECDGQLAGIASGAVLCKPYELQLWLFVDEVDVAVPFRRQGVGTALMSEFFTIAAERHCSEVWVGTEKTNAPAQRLYAALAPSESEEYIGYTFKNG